MSCLPPKASHTRAVLSSQPEAIRVPSWLNATYGVIQASFSKLCASQSISELVSSRRLILARSGCVWTKCNRGGPVFAFVWVHQLGCHLKHPVIWTWDDSCSIWLNTAAPETIQVPWTECDRSDKVLNTEVTQSSCTSKAAPV